MDQAKLCETITHNHTQIQQKHEQSSEKGISCQKGVVFLE